MKATTTRSESASLDCDPARPGISIRGRARAEQDHLTTDRAKDQATVKPPGTHMLKDAASIGVEVRREARPVVGGGL